MSDAAPAAAPSGSEGTASPDTSAQQQSQGSAGAPPPKPPDDEIEFEFEEDLPDGRKEKRKEKLPKSKVAEIVARRKRLDRAAFQRLEETNKLREQFKGYEELEERAKQDPRAVLEFLRKRNIDPHMVAQTYAEEWARQQEMTPEQRAQFQREQALSEREAKLQEAERQRKQAEDQARFEKFRERETQRLLGGLEKSGLPKHPMALSLMNQHAASQAAAGIEEPDYELAAQDTHEFVQEYAKAWLDSLDYEALTKTLGPAVLKKLREGDVARIVPTPGVPGQSRAPAPRKPAEPPQKFLNPREWRAKHTQ